MSNYKISDKDREYFFESYENIIFPPKILFLMLISFSSYLIYWIYKTNKDFLILENNYDIPQPERAISVLIILPSIWFLTIYSIKKFIFHIDNNFLLKIYWDSNIIFYKSTLQILGYIEIIIWILILFLILKYFYDFSLFFGDLTKTNFFTWYIFLSSQVFGFIFLLLREYGLFSLIFFSIICIPAMQAKLNNMYEKYQVLERKNNYYHVNRK